MMERPVRTVGPEGIADPRKKRACGPTRAKLPTGFCALRSLVARVWLGAGELEGTLSQTLP